MTLNKIPETRRLNGFGNPNADAYSILHGLNHRNSGDMAPTNIDHQGYVFFTRPSLNLTTENLRLVRKLHYLTSNDPKSNAAYIRTSLMPWREWQKYEPTSVRSDTADDKLAFFPLLTNTLLSLAGWPDEVVEVSDSAEGLAKQVHGHVDSRPNFYGTFDLTASFVNKEGDPHMVLFSAWREYMTRVAEGSMVPFPEMIAFDEMDYTSRIYVIILGPDKKQVHKIACCGYGFPKALPTGAAFNYNSEVVYSEENQNVDIPFKCYGAIYNDPASIIDFNTTQNLFNPDMENDVRESRMVKLSASEKIICNGYGYPRINPESLELEWWLDFQTYGELMATIKDVLEDEQI